MSPLNPLGITEKELIKRCLENDRPSQKALFELFAGKMMVLCLRYSRYREEAEDFMQEGFVKVFTNLNKFNFDGSFEGWVRRIMVNTCLKNLKKKYVTHEIHGLENYQHVAYDQSIISKLSVDEMIELVNKLPTGYRLVFNMYAIEGYSHKEIGEALNIGESTSRSQLAKARKLLQKQIDQLQKIAV